MGHKVGNMVTFKGYSETPEEGEDLLTPGEQYEIGEVNEEEKQVAVIIDNPDFDSKKKVSDKNPETILVDAFFEELEEGDGEEAAPAKGKAKAAPAAKGKVVPIAKGKTKAAEPEEEAADEPEEAPAKPARGKPAAKTAPAPAKGKAAAKTAPAAKGKAKAPAKEEPESADPYDDLAEEDEDAEIVTLVNDSEDILALATETVEDAAAIEYRLGGVLFHVRKSKAYEALDDKYKEKGGFSLYLIEHLNIEYRKAMYLIEIYYKWNKFQLDPATVAQIGWAKASKIAAVMTDDNAEELLKLAGENTVADLNDHIKTSYKEVGGTKGDKKKLKLFKFKLFESAADAVEETLASVMSGMNFKNLDEAFEYIVMEWATEHPVEGKAPAKAAAGKTPLAAKVAAASGKAKPAGRAKA